MIESSLAGITETQLQQLIVIVGLLIYAYGVRPVIVYVYEWVSDHSDWIGPAFFILGLVVFWLWPDPCPYPCLDPY